MNREHPHGEDGTASSTGSPATLQGDGDASGGSTPSGTTTVAAKVSAANLAALDMIGATFGLYEKRQNRSAAINAAITATAAAISASTRTDDVERQIQKRLAAEQLRQLETVPDVDRQLLEEIRDLLVTLDESYRQMTWEISKVGVNVNQLAHVGNWMKQQGANAGFPEEAFGAVERRLRSIDQRMLKLEKMKASIKDAVRWWK